jgi:hypothetical protein
MDVAVLNYYLLNTSDLVERTSLALNDVELSRVSRQCVLKTHFYCTSTYEEGDTDAIPVD